MSLPVSQYEALLAEVRGLRRKAQRVQQLATPLISNCSGSTSLPLPTQQNGDVILHSYGHNISMNSLGGKEHSSSLNQCEGAASSVEGDTTCSEDECGGTRSTHLSVRSEPIAQRDRDVDVFCHGTWPVEKTMWNSEPIHHQSSTQPIMHTNIDVTSVMSFTSSSGGVPLDRVLGSPDFSRRSSQQLEAKVDMVYSLLAMLSGQEHADMGETLLALSTNPESCLIMRQSGCVPLLVQMVQSDRDPETRKKAAQALHNLVYSQQDEKLRKREVKIFKLLEHARAYTEAVKNHKELELEITSSTPEDGDRHPVQTVAHLMKLSFDELHRQAICQLGGIHVIANLVEAEHINHGSTVNNTHCILMRRYACMALTNLTFGDSGNKALLCSFREFIRALVLQLQSPSDELRQVTASVLRNLSWRADSSSKDILREVGSVTGLMKAAMLDNKENTLKSILSALWNLSAHCTENKSEICSVEGALGFLVDMLTYKTPSKSLAIIENSGGILRNISSQIAVRDDYREILRQHNCLQILLDQLKSPSLTIVSNACGTLWNLSAKNPVDQEILWQLGAPTMLRSLNHSKHKMIAMGSSAALKNLLSARPNAPVLPTVDSTAIAMDLPALPTLGARKQKALLQDLDQTLSETYENIEKDSPSKTVNANSIISGENSNANKDAGQRMSNNHFLDNSDEFSILSIGRPSTSHISGNKSMSLPYMDVSKTSIPVRKSRDEDNFKFGTSERKSFIKTQHSMSSPKNTSVPDQDHMSFSLNNNADSDQRQHILCASSSSCLDNDKLKLKEISCCSDEKDRCSIEDISDTDQSSLGMDHKLSQDSLYSDLAVRKSVPGNVSNKSISLEYPTVKNTRSLNVTMFEGDIDEIDMEDISINVASSVQLCYDSNTEKQDTGKEKIGDLSEVIEDNGFEENLTDFIGVPEENRSLHSFVQQKATCSGIPVPKNFFRSTPNSDVREQSGTSDCLSTEIAISPNNSDTSVRTQSRLMPGLPRRTFLSSTPVKTKGVAGVNKNAKKNEDEVKERGSNLRKDEGSNEAHKVKNIDTDREADCSSSVSSHVECSVPSLNCFTDPSICGINQVHLNISQEHNTSQSDPALDQDNQKSEMQSCSSEIGLQNQECTYLDPEACVNFVIKDDRDRLLERSCEESNLDNRMLDPDAMIESLDRFTAELVSQASHLQSKEEDKFKDNTWNEDTSPNEVTFPSMSSNSPNVITFESNYSSEQQQSEGAKQLQEIQEVEARSNDFSSINTSTMTASTLIAIEATKMATVFKNEADMSNSITSVISLELDKVQPPSFLESLPFDVTNSPKPPRKTLPRGLMIRRALSNSLNTNSSLESLENHSLSNLDQVNPPSVLGDVFDMEASITSVASLPNEMSPQFIINGPVNHSKMTSQLTHLNSVSDLENINPPSFFNEITDLCNSLADVQSEAIGSETEIFEDCQTHVLPTEDDVTEFSDANSITPLHSDISSPETTPKKITRSHGKSLTSKQRRNLARDRYKTYTVAAEMVMKQESDQNNSTSDDFKTVDCFSEEYKSVLSSETTYVSPTYSIKTTPQEKRELEEGGRFGTDDLTKEHASAGANSSINSSPMRSKSSIRRNFIQKRFENRDRFKTQTLPEPTLPDSPLPDSNSASPVLSESPCHTSNDLHFLVEKEANLVLKSLRETKTKPDELLECETLSLVSNDDDSEQNSGSSINYRTYHKSWGLKKNIPVIDPPQNLNPPHFDVEDNHSEGKEEESKEKEDATHATSMKPKIIKPDDKKVDNTEQQQPEVDESQGKGIRGRRKALYSKTTESNRIAPKTIKPIKTMTSNLVKNVTSTLRNTRLPLKNVVHKPPAPQTRASSGYGSKSVSPKTSPARTISAKKCSIERQGTFTKDETAMKSKIPMPGSRIPTTRISAPVTKLPTNNNSTRPKSLTSMSGDKTNRNVRINYARSTSADSRESGTRKIESSSSSQSLKNAGAVKKTNPGPGSKSGSTSNLNSNGVSTKKQVTSKIASLWKRIEETKSKLPAKKDSRVWIESQNKIEQPHALIRSNTFDNKDDVVLRNKAQPNDSEKRISRLGSFIVMDNGEDSSAMPQIISTAE